MAQPVMMSQIPSGAFETLLANDWAAFELARTFDFDGAEFGFEPFEIAQQRGQFGVLEGDEFGGVELVYS